MADVKQKAEDQRITSQATIQLSKAQLPAVNDQQLKVGARVRVVLSGTVRGLDKFQVDQSQEAADTGSLDLEVSNIQIQANSDIADLFEEDLNG